MFLLHVSECMYIYLRMCNQFSHFIKSVSTSIILSTLLPYYLFQMCVELFHVCIESFVENYIQIIIYI